MPSITQLPTLYSIRLIKQRLGVLMLKFAIKVNRTGSDDGQHKARNQHQPILATCMLSSSCGQNGDGGGRDSGITTQRTNCASISGVPPACIVPHENAMSKFRYEDVLPQPERRLTDQQLRWLRPRGLFARTTHTLFYFANLPKIQGAGVIGRDDEWSRTWKMLTSRDDATALAPAVKILERGDTLIWFPGQLHSPP